MPIKANIDLEKANDIITQRVDNGLSCSLGDTVVVNSQEEPLLQMILSRHAVNVRVNDRISVGGAYMTVVPEWLTDAVIEW